MEGEDKAESRKQKAEMKTKQKAENRNGIPALRALISISAFCFPNFCF